MKIEYKHIVAIVYTIVVFLDRLDLTIVNIILPKIAEYFAVPITNTELVTLTFLLAFSIIIPISSWLSGKFGLKNIYIFSIAIFGLGSTFSIWAEDFYLLIALRFIQGIGGGLLIPVGLTMLYRIYDEKEYASITSFTFLPSLISPALSPFLGGVLSDHFGWQSVFLISGPICLALATFSLFYLKEDSYRKESSLDWVGFALSSSLLAAIFYILSLIIKGGIFYDTIIGFLIIAVLIACLIDWEKNHDHPLIDMSLFDNNIFVKVNLIQLCFQICHFGAIFLVSMYLQIGVGMSATIAGFIMGVQALGAMTTSRYSVKLFNKHGAKFPIIIGLLGIAILSPCIMMINKPDMVIFGVVLFFIRGVFSGLCGTPIQTLSVTGFTKEQLSQANSFFNICRQVAISLGTAIFSILISVGFGFYGINDQVTDNGGNNLAAFNLGFLLIPIIAIVGVSIAQKIDAIK
jgi:EmrB/QacA subfamily drug resistance transporter